MSKLFAYSHTQAGIDRLARQRQPVLAIIAPPKQEALPEAISEPCNVIKLVIPRSDSQQIIADIAHEHGLTYADIIGQSRRYKIVAARHEAITAVKAAKPMLSLLQIGRIFHRDYSTIFHALSKAVLHGPKAGAQT